MTVVTVPGAGLRSAVPSFADVRAGAADSALILRLRWRLVRGISSRLMIGIGLFLVVAFLTGASAIGSLVRQYAEQGNDTPAGEFATNYIVALQRGELGSVGAAALGSALAASLFSPFTGAANLALASADDLAALRPRRLHRYFDSIVTSSVSTIGFLQLLTLTGVASLISLNGGRSGALLLTWLVWPTLVLAAVTEGWAIELVHRTYGAKVRRLLALGLCTVLGVALLLDPEHGRSLFGIGTAFAAAINETGAGNYGHTAAAVAVILALYAVLISAGLVMCNIALSKPAVASVGVKAYKSRIPMSRRPRLALLQVLFSQVVRTTEIRRPLATIILLGLPACWIAGDNNPVQTTIIVALPMSVALSWGANAFGVLGPGMTWLSAQPNLTRLLLPLVTAVQVAIVAVLFALFWLPPTIIGQVNGGAVAAVAAGTVVSAALTSASASSKAVRKPILARLGSRGDVLVPPLTAINYTVRFSVLGGQFGVLTLNQDNVPLQACLVGAAIVISLIRYLRVARLWADRTRQARVTALVSAA